MAIQNILQKNINGVAETHYMLRPKLNEALESMLIYPDGKKKLGNYDTYYEYWTNTFGDRFFDMTTFIRLGSVIESNFKVYYMNSVGHKSLSDLQQDSNYKQGVFQQVQSWQTSGVMALYLKVLGINLAAEPKMVKIQEIMMHRHLFAHNSGLIDDKYIENINKITGIDLLATNPNAAKTYPTEDFYWFEPLKNLSEFIEDVRVFFGSLK